MAPTAAVAGRPARAAGFATWQLARPLHSVLDVPAEFFDSLGFAQAAKIDDEFLVLLDLRSLR